MGLLRESWQAFSPSERRNITVYILGIVVYKFGLEAFNGAVVALATNRYDYDALVNKTPSKTFERVGLLTGLNQAFQCVGAILIAPLVKRFRTKNVLAMAILIFAVFSALLLIVDAATGGTFMPESYRGKNHPKNEYSYYGDFNTDGMIPIYCICGIAFGMIELIRRVIPRDIVGGNVVKLKKMDSLVHMFNELSGTAGAFCTALGLIPTFGNNRAFFITPICFSLCAGIFFCVSDLAFEKKYQDNKSTQKSGYLKAVTSGFSMFGESVWVGGKILFSSRKFIWLLPGYTLGLYGHRYLESGIAPPIARRYFGESAWAQIITGGSNLGEFLGAVVVFFTNWAATPIPWIRLDAIMLLAVWYLPFWRPPMGQVGQAWIAAATFLPISFGWSAGDVSLAAYIQAVLSRLDSPNDNVSPLGAVMACLYSVNIVLMAVVSPLLGRYIDFVFNQTGQIYSAITYTAGVHFTIVFVVIFAATFIPRGSLAFNPEMLHGEKLDKDISDSESTSDAQNPVSNEN